MQGKIKLEGKKLLYKKTFKLFTISLLSFILRYGSLSVLFVGFYFLYKSEFFVSLLSTYPTPLVYSVFAFLFLLSFFLILLFVSAVKQGESFIYFSVGEGYKGRFLLLFKFLKPKKAIKSLGLYLYLNFLKLCFFIYFILPTAIVSAVFYYLYNKDSVPPASFIILALGGTFILSISLVMYRCSAVRYSASSYYLGLNPQLKINCAVKKSIHFTDGFLTEGVLLEYSFLGWFLLCVFLLPLIYVVPYYKLCRAVFVCDALYRPQPVKTRYSINYLGLSGQHIN